MKRCSPVPGSAIRRHGTFRRRLENRSLLGRATRNTTLKRAQGPDPRRWHRSGASERGHRLRRRVCGGALCPRSVDLRSPAAAGLAAPVTRASATSRDGRALGGAVRLLRGRFEAKFKDLEAARAAARDARAVGFIVDVQRDGRGWLTVGRRQLPFPGDERDRYASRFHSIATKHGGAFSQFVGEPADALTPHASETTEPANG